MGINDLELRPKSSAHYVFAIKLYLAFKYCIPIDESRKRAKGEPRFTFICEDNYMFIIRKFEPILAYHYDLHNWDVNRGLKTWKFIYREMYLRIQPEFKNLFKIAQNTFHIFQSQLNSKSDSNLEYEQLNLF